MELVDSLLQARANNGDWRGVYDMAQNTGWNANQTAEYAGKLANTTFTADDVNNYIQQQGWGGLANASNAPSANPVRLSEAWDQQYNPTNITTNTATNNNTNTGNYLTMDQLNSWWSQNNPMTNFSSQLDNWWNSKGLSNLYGSSQGVSAPRNAGNRSRYFNPSTGDYQGLGTMYAQPQSL